MPTKTYSYASALYARMLENSIESVIEGESVNVWEGFIGHSCRSLRIPRGMDSRVTRSLTDMGCITVIQKGVGRWPSAIALHYPPTEDLWSESEAGPLTRRDSYARLISRVSDLEKSLGGGNIVEALAALDARVKSLERQVRKGR